MNNLKYQDLYNEDYYLKMVPGLPYDRTANDGHWLRFFNTVADRLITYVSPKSVLDVGCAKGFLLEAFYNRGTLIHGFDCSQYAISCLREDLKPFVFVSSATLRMYHRILLAKADTTYIVSRSRTETQY